MFLGVITLPCCLQASDDGEEASDQNDTDEAGTASDAAAEVRTSRPTLAISSYCCSPFMVCRHNTAACCLQPVCVTNGALLQH